MGRPGRSAELAPAFVYLASNEASYTVGEILAVTGGQADQLRSFIDPAALSYLAGVKGRCLRRTLPSWFAPSGRGAADRSR